MSRSNHYTVTALNTFEQMFLQMRQDLYESSPVDVGEWQSQKIEMPMLEMLHVVFDMPMPETAEELGKITGARLPWAEDHFLERVGGEPLNPSPSEAWWPFAKKGSTTNEDHKSEGQAFSHTYPERMWPKHANTSSGMVSPTSGSHWGIRFSYGDLNDVVNQLFKHPLTRQAYLPIWFPEDTGAVHGKRVPCTLGYHFIIREGRLDISYFMRSTDLLRHFQDDVYLAVRLAQWVVERVNSLWEYKYNEPQQYPLEVGDLIFHTANMHIFEGDRAIIDLWKSQGKSWF
jgi:hypothetical protein